MFLGYSQGKNIVKRTSSVYKKYEYGYLGHWYIKSVLYKRFLNWNKISKKNKVVTGKTPFFLIGPFCTHHSICLNIGFWYDSFVWKWCVFNLSASTKKQYSSFLSKVFVFQKICFKVKVFETFKISTDYHIKTCRSLKGRTILKIPSTVFWKDLCSFRWL